MAKKKAPAKGKDSSRSDVCEKAGVVEAAHGIAAMKAGMEENGLELKEGRVVKAKGAAAVILERSRTEALAEEPLPAAKGGVQEVFLDELEGAPGNRALGDLEELAESVRVLGVLQPVLVRPHPKDDVRYEVVAGHRRVEAARRAGLQKVPALVRELDDRQALEVRLVENLQRKDLEPVEEAEGYRELIEHHGHTAESIAARVHKSRSYVFGRLKVLDLAEPLRRRLQAGELELSQALLVARVSGAKRQAEAFDFLAGHRWSYREAARMLRERFMLELAGAPFDPDDAALVPKAGACGACPKRTGNQPGLFEDVGSADVCTDASCFRAKVDAAAARAEEAHKAAGGKVLGKRKGAELFRWDGRLAGYGEGAKWVEVDKPDQAFGRKTLRKLLGEALPIPVLARDQEGRAHVLVERKEAIAAARAAKLHVPATERRASSGDEPTRPSESKKAKAKRLAEEKVRELFGPLLVRTVVDLVRNQVDLEGKKGHDLAWRLLAWAAVDAAWNGQGDLAAFLAKHEGAKGKRPRGTVRMDDRASAQRILAALAPAERRLEVLELLAAAGVAEWSKDGVEPESALALLVEALPVDLGEVRKRAREASRAPAPEEPEAEEKPRRKA